MKGTPRIPCEVHEPIMSKTGQLCHAQWLTRAGRMLSGEAELATMVIPISVLLTFPLGVREDGEVSPFTLEEN